MSTVVRAPKDKKSRWCYDCPIEHEGYGGIVHSRYYEANTIVKCDDCGRLWLIKNNPYSTYHDIKVLRWYHKAGWGLDRQEA